MIEFSHQCPPPSNQNNNKVRGDAVLSAVVAVVRCCADRALCRYLAESLSGKLCGGELC